MLWKCFRSVEQISFEDVIAAANQFIPS